MILWVIMQPWGNDCILVAVNGVNSNVICRYGADGLKLDKNADLIYDTSINYLSVKSAFRTFRQFLPDFFTHWQEQYGDNHGCSLPIYFQKERISHEKQNAVYFTETMVFPPAAKVFFQ